MSRDRWSNEGYRAIAELLRARSGLYFAESRILEAEYGIDRAMRASGVAAFDRFIELLRNDLRTFDDLVSHVTVGETYFFRDTDQLDCVREEILPSLIRSASADQPLRVWSAGCSTGEEAYSLAIMSEQSGIADRVSILGTDISKEALDRARAATFSEWSLRGLSSDLIERYFSREGDLYALDRRFVRRVTFAYLNLNVEPPRESTAGVLRSDLIFCRNVLIYFDTDSVERAARSLFAALSPGGWLVTAHTDPPLARFAPFDSISRPSGRFYRRPIPSSAIVGDTRLAFASSPDPAPVDRPATSRASQPSHRLPHPRDPAGRARNLAELADALDVGDTERVAGLLDSLDAPEGVYLDCARTLANRDALAAERFCAAASLAHPLSPGLHCLHAVMLLDLRRHDEAVAAARRALYLDADLVVAHLTLGTILRSRGDLPGARRAYRCARDLSTACAPQELVPMSDGDRAGRLAQLAAFQLEQIDETTGTR